MDEVPQQDGGLMLDDDQGAMFRADELRFDAVIDLGEERIVKAVNVQQAAGLAMETELRPGEHFAKFFERAVTAGQGNETIGQISHHGFAVVHGMNDAQISESIMGEFFIDERLGDDADDFAARVENGIGDRAHEANITAAVNEFQMMMSNGFAHFDRCLSICQTLPGTGAAKDTNTFHARQCNGRILKRKQRRGKKTRI